MENQGLPSQLDIRIQHLIAGLCNLLGGRNGLFYHFDDFRDRGSVTWKEAVFAGDTDDEVKQGVLAYAIVEHNTDFFLKLRSTIAEPRSSYVERILFKSNMSTQILLLRNSASRIRDYSNCAFASRAPAKVLVLGINRGLEKTIRESRSIDHGTRRPTSGAYLQ